MQTSYEALIRNSGTITMETIIDAAEKSVPAFYASKPWNYPNLNRGKAILGDEAAMNCYMSAYGRMHTVKMWHVLERLPAIAVCDAFEIVDWGCGQGLATMCLLDMLEKALPSACPEHVTLVDASPVALRRAYMHVSLKLKGRAVVRGVETHLAADDLHEAVVWRGGRVVVHLLSNILDVPGVNLQAVADAIAASDVTSYVVYAGHAKTQECFEAFGEMLERCGSHMLFHQNEPFGDCLPNGYSYGWALGIFRLVDE